MTKLKINRIVQSKKRIEFKERIYTPKPHPRQADIDAYLAIPSLVTGGK